MTAFKECASPVFWRYRFFHNNMGGQYLRLKMIKIFSSVFSTFWMQLENLRSNAYPYTNLTLISGTVQVWNMKLPTHCRDSALALIRSLTWRTTLLCEILKQDIDLTRKSTTCTHPLRATLAMRQKRFKAKRTAPHRYRRVFTQLSHLIDMHQNAEE